MESSGGPRPGALIDYYISRARECWSSAPPPWNALPGGALSDYYFLAACALGSWAPGPVRRACELRRRPGTESTRPSSTDSEIAQPRTASAPPPPARAPPAAMMVVLRGRERHLM